MTHPAALPPESLLAACEQQAVRRAGPGGQHRNKAHTGVVLRHLPSGVRAEGSGSRLRQDNLRAALFRLRVNLALELRGPAPEGPSALWRSRTRGGRLAVNAEHADFPALLAEALDVLAAHDHEVVSAAPWLGVSGTQLVRFLAKEPRALVALNAVRAARGLRALRE
jgi:hypothetical protein